KCPRCKGEGLVVHAALDHDKVAALFKEQEESRSDPDTFSEEFSKELREAEDEVKKGKSITRDELSKRMESWKE
nr:hypothetical protein [Candidatus Sigynarchaeota archaeon]